MVGTGVGGVLEEVEFLLLHSLQLLEMRQIPGPWAARRFGTFAFSGHPLPTSAKVHGQHARPDDWLPAGADCRLALHARIGGGKKWRWSGNVEGEIAAHVRHRRQPNRLGAIFGWF